MVECRLVRARETPESLFDLFKTFRGACRPFGVGGRKFGRVLLGHRMTLAFTPMPRVACARGHPHTPPMVKLSSAHDAIEAVSEWGGVFCQAESHEDLRRCAIGGR